MKKAAAALAGLTMALGLGVSLAAPSNAGTESRGTWDNCTKVNQKYPHGVGKKHAHDHTTGTRVTNFKHSNKLYRVAMQHNAGLDGDKDKIACEKA